MVGMDQRHQASAPTSEPTGITTMAAVTVDQRPTSGETRPATSRPSEKPPIANVSDQPCSAAISGTVSTGE